MKRGEAIVRHGHSRKFNQSPTYKIWIGMKQRCTNPKMDNYARYGGRGIAVCERWLSFENFLADMGERPSPNLSLDRYPNTNGNYEPGNCRWATLQEQAANRRPPRKVINRRGNKLTVETVRAIRASHDTGTLQKAIAAEFRISKAMACLIINRKCWVNA